jgi:hypothetical protein
MSVIDVIRGDDESIQLTFTDVNDNVIDLTGSTVFFTVKRKIEDTDDDAVIKKEVSVFAAPTTGVAIITLTDDDTNLTSGVYYYDVQLVDQAGLVSSIRQDKFKVHKDVTIRIT